MSRADETKTKILAAAAALFAKSGYEGTSVREIAKMANVNIAAINYHFGNKDKLYWETFVQSIQNMEKHLEALEASGEIEDFVWQMFLVLKEQQDSLINTFKLMLSASVPEPQGQHEAFCANNQVGPPGGQYLAKLISSKYPNLSFEKNRWAVKMIFSNIVHLALISNSPYVVRLRKVSEEFSDADLQMSIADHTRAIIQYVTK